VFQSPEGIAAGGEWEERCVAAIVM